MDCLSLGDVFAVIIEQQSDERYVIDLNQYLTSFSREFLERIDRCHTHTHTHTQNEHQLRNGRRSRQCHRRRQPQEVYALVWFELKQNNRGKCDLISYRRSDVNVDDVDDDYNATGDDDDDDDIDIDINDDNGTNKAT
jgi:hypothetical protein